MMTEYVSAAARPETRAALGLVGDEGRAAIGPHSRSQYGLSAAGL